ncbi:TetR/AcrR family transcriptional regulator [Burkholderia multivorans]|uniref:TetR/AcrR family transcriptional regulator n=1 Tax=Burkholderia multivorans TaxID=87883 RepID=A0A2S9MYY6_9BURK|nr:TetR/AcrR family transcriptional regulator [Burkholderia multivorans]MBU9143558.1 TetR/AcrR family transcriptional regulator [Burkholderia multivorans]MBU9512033.1 TetR/AcrR family transcriptional regulator [Burkholderia multivorans]MBU9524186.1 TetR/AcrR family transcriptional regulator [Burkholderia multivorans]MBU9535950.1 TetR/AcrR family transcriptional regulator [Burkholderia multivorans]MBU9636102.1 TetR/AcrR family transcriptional regulator [Burkholderia multivorans]
MTPPPADSGRRARKRIQMLAHLADTAARLFDAHGYDAVTMEQIADEADVAKRTLYNHFATKEAVLAHWLERELARDLAHLQRDVARRRTFASRIACVLDASAAWCEQHPAHLLAYLRHRFLSIGATAPEGGDPGRGDIAPVWHRLIADAQRAGELNRSLPAEQLATCFHHLYLGAMLRWLTVPGLSLKQEFRAIAKLFVEGAQAAPTAPRASRAAPAR